MRDADASVSSIRHIGEIAANADRASI